MLNAAAAAFMRLSEFVLGRAGLWRMSRRLYLTARRDGAGDPSTNGEYALHRRVASQGASQTTALSLIDVGAYTGYWSHHLLSSCRTAGVGSVRLLAFEPSHEIRNRFADRMAGAFPGYDVRVRPEAVSDHVGESLFDTDASRVGTNSLIPPGRGNEAGGTALERVTVLTLVDVFEQEGITVADFVKTDVEGFDLSIIRGALPLLEGGKIGLLQFEYNHCWLETRSLLRDVFDLLPRIPYRLGKVVPDGIETFRNWNPEIEKFYEANYVLVRNDLAVAYGVKDFEFDCYNTLRRAR